MWLMRYNTGSQSYNNVYFQHFIQSHKVVTPLIKTEITREELVLDERRRALGALGP